MDLMAHYRECKREAIEKGGSFDPLTMDLRPENEVCAWTNKWGEEWIITGGTTFPLISRPTTAHAVIPDRDKVELSGEIDSAEKYYREWLLGQHDEATRIQDPNTLRTTQQRVMQSAYEPRNQAGVVPRAERKMDWGDRSDYVCPPEKQQKRDLLVATVIPMLNQKCFSMDTIATALGCDRDYVRQISKQMCPAEEHREHLKRKDS